MLMYYKVMSVGMQVALVQVSEAVDGESGLSWKRYPRTRRQTLGEVIQMVTDLSLSGFYGSQGRSKV